MCVMGTIFQQRKQNIKRFMGKRMLATFHQFGLHNCVTVSISSKVTDCVVCLIFPRLMIVITTETRD